MDKNQQDEKGVVFKRLFGVKLETFGEMRAILQKEYDKLHKSGGRPPRLTIEDKLFVTLKYLREYRTMESIGADYGISKGRVCETLRWVEDTLAKAGAFKLPGKKARTGSAPSIEYLVVDVAESPVQRPKKNRTSGIPGKRSATP